MKALEIRSDLHQKIEALNSKELNEVYGLFQNYLNSHDDASSWSNLSVAQKDRIMTGLQQANAHKTKPLNEVTSRLRAKYSSNG